MVWNRSIAVDVPGRTVLPARRKARFRAPVVFGVVPVVAIFTGLFVSAEASTPPSVQLQVSVHNTRSAPVPLQGQKLTGDVYVFAKLSGGRSTDVTFWLDGRRVNHEKGTPYDLAGTVRKGRAAPLSMMSLASGKHTVAVTAVVGRSTIKSAATFTSVRSKSRAVLIDLPPTTPTPSGTPSASQPPAAGQSPSASQPPAADTLPAQPAPPAGATPAPPSRTPAPPAEPTASPAPPAPPAPPASAPSPTPGAYAAMRATLRVVPGGNGDCSLSAPCGSVPDAVAKAHAGSVIEVGAGSYGPQVIAVRSGSSSWASNVVVRPAAGAAVRFASLDFSAAHVTVTGVTVEGTVRFRTEAVGSGIDAVTISGGSAMVAATQSFVRRSRIMPSIDTDGIQVKAYGGNNPSGVSIESNVIGPTHRGPDRAHVDCIQILGGTNVSIRGNTLFHCASEGIIAGSGATGTVGSIDIERNVIQLCPVRTYDCDGYNAVNVNGPKVTFAHNTVIDGGTVFGVDDLTLTGNYIENLKSCDGTITGNLIGSTRCTLGSSNRIGTPTFVNRGGSPPDARMVTPVVLPGASGAVGARN